MGPEAGAKARNETSNRDCQPGSAGVQSARRRNIQAHHKATITPRSKALNSADGATPARGQSTAYLLT